MQSRRLNGLILVVGIAAFIYILFTLSFEGAQFSCEVCQEYRGRTDCRTASGATEAEATRTAIDTACGLLSGGDRTLNLQCIDTKPRSVTCE